MPFKVSRLVECRKSFWSLTAVIYGLHENPPRVIQQELGHIVDSRGGNYSDDDDDEALYAAAWYEISTRLELPLTHPSRHYREATSFHALVADITYAIVLGRRSASAGEAKLCRGWDANYLYRMLMLEAGWVEARKQNQTATDDHAIQDVDRTAWQWTSPQLPKNWKSRFRWSDTTWKRRRNDCKEAFMDIPASNMCKIRRDYLALWDEEAKAKSI